ncbi:unnamed protein product [Pleuronectes platessa]|uniref:Uncharacterized protein n=1 Tax=Pleuronectes platessa TaxID=8262 RepID=A0A9N7VYZ8_PLEPL|nr:unnamed protein product [Pleuronectes platessa]
MCFDIGKREKDETRESFLQQLKHCRSNADVKGRICAERLHTGQNHNRPRLPNPCSELRAKVIKAEEKRETEKGRRGMAPRWLKGTFMQLLASIQTLAAARNCSDVALRGAEEEEETRSLTPLKHIRSCYP